MAQLKGPPTYSEVLWQRMEAITTKPDPEPEANNTSDSAVVGYFYAGQAFHGLCLCRMMCLPESQSVEKTLNDEAKHHGWDRQDETSFRSDQFPHRIRRRDADQYGACRMDGGPLDEDSF